MNSEDPPRSERVIVTRRPRGGPAPGPGAQECAAFGRPVLELGAPSPGGLRLPDAKPTASALYAPRGACFLPNGGLVVADTGNHRVLIWRRPESFGDADVVLGQVDFDHEGPQAAGRGAERGLHLPTGVAVHEGRLFVCDAWNHRVVIWDSVPERSDTPPDHVLGQADLAHGESNRGGAVQAFGFDCPYGLAIVDGCLFVADTQNRRVVRFDGVPNDSSAVPIEVIGQDDFESGEENRGRGVGADTMRWPHALASSRPGELWIADAGNHRLLGFGGQDRSGAADAIVGQERPDTAFELPHVPQGPHRLRFPYGLVADERQVIVADTANNRVLRFEAPMSGGAAAIGVLGQRDFDSAGENRWESIAPDTLCWPYGLALVGDRLAIADSGNNRVVVYELDPLG